MDGDVWEPAANLVARKGPDAIRVIWTKGHATEKDVREGKTSEAHKKGNDIADLVAEAAHELQPTHKALALRHASARWTAAQRVVQAVHAFLRDAIAERSVLRRQQRDTIATRRAQAAHRQRERQARGERIEQVVTNGDPWHPDTDVMRDASALPAAAPSERRDTPLRAAVARVLRSWTWSVHRAEAHSSGVTWLELQVALLLDDNIVALLIHDMRGRGCPGLHHEKADPERIFRALRTAIRSATTRRAGTALQGMGTKVARLRVWGIRSGLACLQGAPSWPKAIRDDVKHAVLMAHATKRK